MFTITDFQIFYIFWTPFAWNFIIVHCYLVLKYTFFIEKDLNFRSNLADVCINWNRNTTFYPEQLFLNIIYFCCYKWGSSSCMWNLKFSTAAQFWAKAKFLSRMTVLRKMKYNFFFLMTTLTVNILYIDTYTSCIKFMKVLISGLWGTGTLNVVKF